jgi:hypothetical protein
VFLSEQLRFFQSLRNSRGFGCAHGLQVQISRAAGSLDALFAAVLLCAASTHQKYSKKPTNNEALALIEKHNEASNIPQVPRHAAPHDHKLA